MLRDDSLVRAGLAPLVKAAQGTITSGCDVGAIGIGVDEAVLLVELLPHCESVTASDLVLRLREYKPPASAAAAAAVASATPASALPLSQRYGRVHRTPVGGAASTGTLGPLMEVVTSKAGAALALLDALMAKAGTGTAPIIRIAKPPAFGPPVTAQSAATCKWEALLPPADHPAYPPAPFTPSSLACPVLSHGASLTAPPLGLRDGVLLLWRRDTHGLTTDGAAAAGGASAASTGASATSSSSRVPSATARAAMTSASASGPKDREPTITIATNKAAARREQGIRIRMGPPAAGFGAGTGTSTGAYGDLVVAPGDKDKAPVGSGSESADASVAVPAPAKGEGQAPAPAAQPDAVPQAAGSGSGSE